jgi:mRNA interferase RelE/StbE
MKLEFTDSFNEDYDALPDEMKKRTDKALRLFVANPRHPSLQAAKMEGCKNVWEARVTNDYRFTYSMKKGGICVLRRVGPHDVESNP